MSAINSLLEEVGVRVNSLTPEIFAEALANCEKIQRQKLVELFTSYKNLQMMYTDLKILIHRQRKRDTTPYPIINPALVKHTMLGKVEEIKSYISDITYNELNKTWLHALILKYCR